MKNKILAIITISLLFSSVLFVDISNAKEERERLENGKPTLYNDDTENTIGTTTERNKGKEENGLAEEHRSDVSKFVQTLLDVANRNNGIGEKVRVIAREQASSTDEVVKAMNAIQNRSNFKTFLIGTDYKNVGKIRSEISQTRNRISELNRELEKVSTSTDKTNIENEITSLEADQTKLENFVKTFEGKFSLLGWIVRLFQ